MAQDRKNLFWSATRISFSLLFVLWFFQCPGGSKDCRFPHPPKIGKDLSCHITEQGDQWKLEVSSGRWRKVVGKYPSEERAYEECRNWREHVKNLVHAEARMDK